MRSFFAFVRYELLMHLKSWRFWLAFAALVGVTTPWSAVITVVPDAERMDRIMFEFLNVTFAGAVLFLPVVIVVAVESVARLRGIGMHALLYTKPFATLSMVLGTWAAVVLLGVILAAGTLLSYYLVVSRYLDLEVYARPLVWIVLLGAMPIAMGVGAISIWARIVFGHTVVAYLASGLAAIGLILAAREFDPPLAGFNMRYVEPLVREYVPAIGRDIDWLFFGPALLHTLLFSLLLLSLSCYHLRRRTLQGMVVGRYGRHWADMPTFVQLIDGFRIDRHAGASTHFASLITLTLAGLVGWQSATHGRDQHNEQQRWANELKIDLPAQAPAHPGLHIRHYAGDLHVYNRRDLRFDLRMDLENTTKSAVSEWAFAIPFGLDVERLENASGGPIEHRRWGNVILARLTEQLDPGASTSVRLVCAGRPLALAIGDRIPFSDEYAVLETNLEDQGIWLKPNYLRLPSGLLPRSVAFERRQFGMTPIETPRLFTADLNVMVFCRDAEIVSPEAEIRRSSDTKEGATVRQMRLDKPRSEFVLFAGPYEKVTGRFGTLDLIIYCFAQDRLTFEFAAFEYAESIERWAKILGPPEDRPCVIIETPFQYVADDGSQAGTISFAQVQLLRRYKPLFEARNPAGASSLYRFQSILSFAIASKILRESFHPEQRIAPLAPTLYAYLTANVQRSAIGPMARRDPSLFMREMKTSIDQVYFDPTRKALFDTPLLERMTWPTFASTQETHIWRMLHYLLEDDRFAAFIRRMLGEYHDRILTLEDLQTVAESVYGEPLDWFFRHWFYERGIPAYEITEARASLAENPDTRDIEYDVRVRVRNKGRGRMPVPVVLTTERDRIERKLWLDSGDEELLRIHVPDRPEVAFVDPEGWIAQEAYRDPDSGTRGIVRRKIRVME